MLDCHLIIDVTGSMSAVAKQVAKNTKDLISRLNRDLPETQIAVTLVGNHANNPTHVHLPLTELNDTTEKVIHDFLSLDYRYLGGGYSKGFKGSSCSAVYELGLKLANEAPWRDNSSRVVVMVGDEEASELARGVDWREQTNNLLAKNVVIYGVQCLNNSRVSYFYADTAKATGGHKLELGQFSDISEIITAIAYKSKDDDSLEAFALELKAKSRMNRNLFNQFEILSGNTKLGEKLDLNFTSYSGVLDSELKPVDPSRFQVLTVDNNQDIKSFVIASGANFKPGQGFYELTKTEEIQERKEVVLVEKLSGDAWSGTVARTLVGLPMGQRGNLNPKTIDNSIRDRYTIYVQSTSNNRKLMGGTKFLYEVVKKS